jgi:hypothetical protein
VCEYNARFPLNLVFSRVLGWSVETLSLDPNSQDERSTSLLEVVLSIANRFIEGDPYVATRDLRFPLCAAKSVPRGFAHG